MNRVGGAARFGLLAAIDVLALTRLAPNWSALGTHVAHLNTWVNTVGPDTAVASIASAVLWLLAAWVAIALLVVLVAQSPGRLGAGARGLAHRVLPRTVLRIVIAVTGFTMLALPGVAAANPSPAPGPSWPTSAAPQLPSAGWPATTAPRLPTASWPVTTGPSSTPATSSRPTAPTVVVRPGDCLWDIAASHLDHPTAQQIEHDVLGWYSLNRSAIGPDPNLLHPGQVLIAPHPIHPTSHPDASGRSQ
jgi:hypothetical protein